MYFGDCYKIQEKWKTEIWQSHIKTGLKNNWDFECSLNGQNFIVLQKKILDNLNSKNLYKIFILKFKFTPSIAVSGTHLTVFFNRLGIRVLVK
jgi:hypothetical protein